MAADVEQARDFAIAAHGDQRYGSLPYATHLSAVAEIVREFGLGDEYEAAAWLHDVAEDTPITVSQLRAYFGNWIADVVKACTGVGHNRRERNACIYERVGRFPDAAPVKVADRIANVEAAIEGSSHAQMYWKEAVAFHEAVARFAPEAMRKRLNRAYSACRASSTGS